MNCQYNNDMVAATRAAADRFYQDLLNSAEDWPTFYAWLEKVFIAQELTRTIETCETCKSAVDTIAKHSFYAYFKTRQVADVGVSFYGFRASFVDEFHKNVMDNIAFITRKEKQA